jgi:hypothetical protein
MASCPRSGGQLVFVVCGVWCVVCVRASVQVVWCGSVVWPEGWNTQRCWQWWWRIQGSTGAPRQQRVHGPHSDTRAHAKPTVTQILSRPQNSNLTTRNPLPTRSQHAPNTQNTTRS